MNELALFPDKIEMTLDTVLQALADPLRRNVIAQLARELDGTERSCISFGLPITKATRTHHIRVLREAGLIKQVDYGNRRPVSLRRAEIEAQFPGLLALILAEKLA